LYVQMLVKRWPPPPEAADIAAQIQTSAERMRALISDLLLDSRSAHAPAEFGPADADQALDRALRQLRKEIDDADATVVRQPLPALLASEAELELVLRNLLSNALKYRSDSPLRIEIAAEVAEGWCTISVRDNGIGIDPAYHERIFGLFRRLHGPAVPGTGIGLAVVRNVVEKCGGKVWVESEPGRGATFRFRLRTATAAAFSIVA
jgi:signal transduction histidine kinase